MMLLLFSGTAPRKDSLEKIYVETKKQDSLAAYLDHLFDFVDAAPQNLIGSDDSLMTTIWRAPKTFTEKYAYYNLVINIAYHLLQQRQIPASIKWYEQAYKFYNENKQDAALEQEMYFEEYVSKPLGNNYTRMGDFSKAIFIQQTAIISAKQKGLYDILPGLYANIATTYFHTQQYDSVQHYIDVGLQNIPAAHPQILNLYNLKTEAFFETRQTDSAVFWNNRATVVAKNFSITNEDAVIITYLDQAKILNQSKAYPDAIKVLRIAWELAQKENVAEKVEIAIEMGNAFLLANKTDSSIYWHQIALGFFKLNDAGLYPDFKVTTSMFGIATALMYREPDSAAVWFEKAVLNDYYTQQLLPTSLNSRTAAYANSKYSEVAIALHHQLYDQTKNNKYLLKAMWLAEISKGRQLLTEQERSREWVTDSTLIKNKSISDELRSLYLNLAETDDENIIQKVKFKIQELEYGLNLTESNYDKLLKIPSYNEFEKWVNENGEKTSVISYYWGQSYVYAVSISGNNYAHFLDTAVAQNMKLIQAFTHTFFYNGPDAFNNNPDEYYRQAGMLLKKYNPWFTAGVENLLVSADGPLHLLPFEALNINERTPEYLGKQCAVSYSFSFLQYAASTNLKGSKNAINVFTFRQPHLGFAALNEAAKEERYLSSNFKTESLNAAITSTNDFIRSLQSGNVIHFASHAVANDSMQQGFLVLNEKLYLAQLQYITAKCPLMVLAACETGAGTLKEGEGMESLARAFISKGVNGVISTRWPVDDKVAAEMTRLFYEQLRKVKKPAKALQLATQQYMNNNKAYAAQNPWLWAAFTYQGINQNVELAGKSNLLLIISITAFAFLLLIFWSRLRKK